MPPSYRDACLRDRGQADTLGPGCQAERTASSGSGSPASEGWGRCTRATPSAPRGRDARRGRVDSPRARRRGGVGAGRAQLLVRRAARRRRHRRDRRRGALDRPRPRRDERSAAGSTCSSRSPARRRSPTTTRSSTEAERRRAPSSRSGTTDATTPGSSRQRASCTRARSASRWSSMTRAATCARPSRRTRCPAGGFLVDMASHDYDTACWLLGQEPERVHVQRQVAVYPELDALGDLDNAVVTIRFDGGGIATTHVSRTCAWGHDVRLEVVGDEGSMLIGNDASHPGVSVVTPPTRLDSLPTIATCSRMRTAPSCRRSCTPARIPALTARASRRTGALSRRASRPGRRRPGARRSRSAATGPGTGHRPRTDRRRRRGSGAERAMDNSQVALLDRSHRSQVVLQHRDTVLLQHRPTVRPASSGREHGREVDAAFPERAEEALLPGFARPSAPATGPARGRSRPRP